MVTSIAVLYIYYRKDIPKSYPVSELALPHTAIKDNNLFRLSWIILSLLLAAYFTSGWLRIPVSLFAGLATVWFLLAARKSQAVPVRTILKQAPWKIVVFSIGMYVVVYGLQNVGLTELLGTWIQAMASNGVVLATLGMGFLAAGLSSVMNNMPTVMINALAIQTVDVSPQIARALQYANVIGSDLGPKITPIGSLATLLWLHVLALKGIRITWGYYFKVGILLTIPVLFVTLLSLAGWLLFIH
jgi:arsenical pump membrane protein